jgi:hypothetical protein
MNSVTIVLQYCACPPVLLSPGKISCTYDYSLPPYERFEIPVRYLSQAMLTQKVRKKEIEINE